MKCAVSACEIEATRKGLCNKHYRRMKAHGDPNTVVNRPAGSGTPHNRGYWMYEINGRSVMRHILLAETALGKPLPHGAEVHHVDEDRGNDSPGNLVVCQDRGYHALLHKRAKALAACGHANWIMCQICKRYSPPEEIRAYKNGVKWHPECWAVKFGRRGSANGLHVQAGQ